MSDKELTGKVAIVTGSGRNIGRAIALALADGGATVIVNARSNQAEADAVVREIEGKGGKAAAIVGCRWPRIVRQIIRPASMPRAR